MIRASVAMSMAPRCVVLLFMLYVSMDFASPWVPGAFVFDADESVDGLSPRRDILVMPETGAPRPVVKVEPLTRAPRRALTVRPLAGGLAELRRAHAPSPELSPPTEDH